MPGHFEHMKDEQLLALFYKTKDQKWLGVLLERYTMLLLGVCLKYLKDREKAEDAVQQVFLKTLSAAHHTQINNMGAWLYQVARNECFSQLRLPQEQLFMKSVEGLQLADESGLFPEIGKDEISKERLDAAIEDLNERQKNCIVLFYLKNKSYQEIAELLQITVGEVKSHIQNGKRNLKINLSRTSYSSEKGGSHG